MEKTVECEREEEEGGENEGGEEDGLLVEEDEKG